MIPAFLRASAQTRNRSTTAKRLRSIAATVLMFSLSTSLHATVVNYTLTGNIASTGGLSDFTVGDTYDINFSLDHSVLDGNPSTTASFFSTALSNFSISRSGQNTTGWNPAGAHFIPTGPAVLASIGSLNFFSGQIGAFIGGAPANGLDLSSVGFSIVTPANALTTNDQGFGQSLFEQLGNQIFNPASILTPQSTFTFEFGPPQGSSSVVGFISNLAVTPTTVPLPAGLPLLLSGIAGLWFARRRTAKTG